MSEPHLVTTPEPRPEHLLTCAVGHWSYLTPGTLVAAGAIAGVLPHILNVAGFEGSPTSILWYLPGLSWILIAVSFSVMAIRAYSQMDRPTMISGWLIVAATLLLARDEFAFVVPGIRERSRNFLLIEYPILFGVAALLGVAFGVAVNRPQRVRWASFLIFWGLCGLAGAVIWYVSFHTEWTGESPPLSALLATYSWIFQSIILLVVGIMMHIESRRKKNGPATAST